MAQLDQRAIKKKEPQQYTFIDGKSCQRLITRQENLLSFAPPPSTEQTKGEIILSLWPTCCMKPENIQWAGWRYDSTRVKEKHEHTERLLHKRSLALDPWRWALHMVASPKENSSNATYQPSVSSSLINWRRIYAGAWTLKTKTKKRKTLLGVWQNLPHVPRRCQRRINGGRHSEETQDDLLMQYWITMRPLVTGALQLLYRIFLSLSPVIPKCKKKWKR